MEQQANSYANKDDFSYMFYLLFFSYKDSGDLCGATVKIEEEEKDVENDEREVPTGKFFLSATL